LTRDTYDGSIAEPITLNHYAYANSSPTMYVDPSGNVGMMEVQFNIAVRSSLQGMQNRFLGKVMQEVGKELGCDIAVTFVTHAVQEGAGIYLFSSGNKPYVGRTNNFTRRLNEHLRGKLKHMNDVLGRVTFSGTKKVFSSRELNAIEELIIRSIDDMTGGGLSGMSNSRYNYKKNSGAYRKLIDKVKTKCKGR